MKSWIGQPFTFEMLKQVFDISTPFIAHTKGFNEWAEATKKHLAPQAARWLVSHASQGLKYPIKSCSIAIYHYWADRVIRDNSNKAETINDLLVDLGIIASDNYRCRRSGKDEAEVYAGEINDHITHITISAYSW